MHQLYQLKSCPTNDYCAAVVIGRITGFVIPSVRPSVLYAKTDRQSCCERTQSRSNCSVRICSSKGYRTLQTKRQKHFWSVVSVLFHMCTNRLLIFYAWHTCLSTCLPQWRH